MAWAATAGCRAQTSVAFKMERSAALVATGLLRMKSWFTVTMQQKYDDQGLSAMLLTISCPTFFARRSWTVVGSASIASILPSMKFCFISGIGKAVQVTSVTGLMLTVARMLDRKT